VASVDVFRKILVFPAYRGTATIRAKLFVESFYLKKIKLLPGIFTSWTKIKINGYVDLHFGGGQ